VQGKLKRTRVEKRGNHPRIWGDKRKMDRKKTSIIGGARGEIFYQKRLSVVRGEMGRSRRNKLNQDGKKGGLFSRVLKFGPMNRGGAVHVGVA